MQTHRGEQGILKWALAQYENYIMSIDRYSLYEKIPTLISFIFGLGCKNTYKI